MEACQDEIEGGQAGPEAVKIGRCCSGTGWACRTGCCTRFCMERCGFGPTGRISRASSSPPCPRYNTQGKDHYKAFVGIAILRTLHLAGDPEQPALPLTAECLPPPAHPASWLSRVM